MAASALMAAADGTVSFAERVRLDQLLTSLEALQAFDVHESIRLFDDYVAELREHPERGAKRAHAALHRMAEDPQSADLLLKIAHALTRSDGVFTPAEKRRLHAIAQELDVPPPPGV